LLAETACWSGFEWLARKQWLKKSVVKSATICFLLTNKTAQFAVLALSKNLYLKEGEKECQAL
jgi:hypothetical protein